MGSLQYEVTVSVIRQDDDKDWTISVLKLTCFLLKLAIAYRLQSNCITPQRTDMRRCIRWDHSREACYLLRHRSSTDRLLISILSSSKKCYTLWAVVYLLYFGEWFYWFGAAVKMRHRQQPIMVPLLPKRKPVVGRRNSLVCSLQGSQKSTLWRSWLSLLSYCTGIQSTERDRVYMRYGLPLPSRSHGSKTYA